MVLGLFNPRAVIFLLDVMKWKGILFLFGTLEAIIHPHITLGHGLGKSALVFSHL
jgi:hypothetical protein